MAKQAHGNGSIRRRKDGRWEGRCNMGIDRKTGKPIVKSIYGKSQREVAEQLRKLAVQRDEHTYEETSKMKFSAWLDIYVKDCMVSLKPYTQKTYERVIRNHIKPELGNYRLEELSSLLIQRFINGLRNSKDGKPLAPKTVKSIHGILHTTLDLAKRNGYLAKNPADLTRLPRREKVEMHPLMDEHVKEFMRRIHGHELEQLFLVDLFTGMRLSEVLGLQWKDVDFERRLIHVRRQLQPMKQDKGGYQFVSPKNGKGRIIAPASFVFDVLKKQQARQDTWCEQAGANWDNPDDLVFTNALGRHLCHGVVYRNVKRIFVDMGIPDTRFHDLRHSFAVISLQSGDDPKTVQENMGHYSASFTLDVYGHVSEEMRRASAARMDAYITNLNATPPPPPPNVKTRERNGVEYYTDGNVIRLLG